MGYAAEDLEVPLVQFVALYEGGEKIAMTTRGGKFVTLRQLREEKKSELFVYRSLKPVLMLRLNEQLLKIKETII